MTTKSAAFALFLCLAALAGAAHAAPPAAQPAQDPDPSSVPAPVRVPIPVPVTLTGFDAVAGEASADSAPARPARADGRTERLLRGALALLGTPYRWGGTSPDRGFDCSGLVGYLYRTVLGIELPRVSREQARTGELVADRAAMATGDLVFFGRRGRVDHVGIYIGEGRFVHAPSRGKDVTVSSLDEGYWGGRFLQARRVAL